MSREDPEMMAAYVNGNKAGAARYAELPATGHTFQHYLNMADAFAGREAPFDPAVARVLTDWFQRGRNGFGRFASRANDGVIKGSRTNPGVTL